MNLMYLESTQQAGSFDVSIDIRFPFLNFRLLLSLLAPYLQFITMNCLKHKFFLIRGDRPNLNPSLATLIFRVITFISTL